MEDTQQPKIRFFRTRWFWSRVAGPGLLLALWVEGMLFSQYISTASSTPSSTTTYRLGIASGILYLGAFESPKMRSIGVGSPGWAPIKADLRWYPNQPMLFPRLYEPAMPGRIGRPHFGRVWQFKVPLWFPLLLGVVFESLWLRHRRRKLAKLRTQVPGDEILASIDIEVNECRPKLRDSLLVTKRFWLSWAFPALLLAIWLAGMLFRMGITIAHYAPASPTVCYLSIWDGNAVLTSRPLSLPNHSVSKEWDYLDFSFEWHPGLELFPRFYRDGPVIDILGKETQDRVIKFPLWPPFFLWMICTLAWSRLQSRKQVALQTTPDIPTP